MREKQDLYKELTKEKICKQCKGKLYGVDFPMKNKKYLKNICKNCLNENAKKHTCVECNQKTNVINKNQLCVPCNEKFGLRECIRCT